MASAVVDEALLYHFIAVPLTTRSLIFFASTEQNDCADAVGAEGL